MNDITKYTIKLCKLKNGSMENRLLQYNRNEAKEVLYDILRLMNANGQNMYNMYDSEAIARSKTIKLIDEIKKLLDKCEKIGII